MIFPCPSPPLDCPGQGNLDYDTPLKNLSSELPDAPEWPTTVNPSGDVPPGPDIPIPLGAMWTAYACDTFAYSYVSQADADAKAQVAADDCEKEHVRYPIPLEDHNINRNETDGEIRIYWNTEQRCSHRCIDGDAFEAVVPEHQFWAFTQARADELARQEACRRAGSEHICLGALDPNACLHQPYNSAVSAENATPPAVFVINSGQLPPGLYMHQTGEAAVSINGVPTAEGEYSFQILVSDNDGKSKTRDYKITVRGITPNPLGPLSRDIPVQQQLLFGQGVAQFALVSGVLPPGMLLTPSGLFVGTPHVPGVYIFTIAARDALGNVCQDDLSCTVLNTTGPNWWLISWICGGSGTGVSGGSGNFTQGSATSSPAWPPPNPPPQTSGFAACQGTLKYNGPDAFCRLDMTGGALGYFGATSYAILVVQRGPVTLFQKGFSSSPFVPITYPPGTYSFNFNILDTGGSEVTFYLATYLEAVPDWSAGSSVHAQWQIVNT